MPRRTVQDIIDEQNTTPVFLTNGTLDALQETLMPEVFNLLGFKGCRLGELGDHIGEAVEDEFYPLTPKEAKFVAEDWAASPYGGAFVAYAVLWMGKRYLAPTVQICFDGPKRPFSVESYGRGADAIYENKASALREASNLAAFLRRKLRRQLVYVYPNAEDDRHYVMVMFPVEQVVRRFKDYDDFKLEVAALFPGYEHQPSQLVRTA